MELMMNRSLDYFNMSHMNDLNSTLASHCWAILIVALPLELLAIHRLVALIKKDHVIPVYVINLLISDIIQLFAKPITLSIPPTGIVFELIAFAYLIGLLASIFFMVCISCDRYTMIAHPLWYRFHRTIRTTMLCSFAVWLSAISAISTLVLAVWAEFVVVDRNYFSLSVLLFLAPYPFVLFFFLGTWLALSKSVSVSHREKRRILGTLIFVLFIYTALYVPYIVVVMTLSKFPQLLMDPGFQILFVVSSDLLCLNPLVDPILYIFMSNKSAFIPFCHLCFLSCPRQQFQQEDTEN